MSDWEPGVPLHLEGSHYPRRLIEILDDHCPDGRDCAICDYGMGDVGGAMRWSPRFPVGMEQGPYSIRSPWSEDLHEVVPF